MSTRNASQVSGLILFNIIIMIYETDTRAAEFEIPTWAVATNLDQLVTCSTHREHILSISCTEMRGPLDRRPRLATFHGAQSAGGHICWTAYRGLDRPQVFLEA